MSNLYSKIGTKPVKRFQDNIAVTQTNAWVNAESPSNVSGSPPSISPITSSIVLQREGVINQPLSTPASPLSSLCSPLAQLNLLSTEDCTQDPNWQATKSTVRERNAAMFNNHLMADIQFIVGNPGHTQSIPAHKYVLATGSSVFYAMFYGGLAENKRDIEVPDVEPAAFLALLRYMYCDEVQLEADTVLATLYVAKKYIVPHLARACVNYLETSLTAKNACLLLSQSRLFEEPDLMQRCWEVIDAQVSLNLKPFLLTMNDEITKKNNIEPNNIYSTNKLSMNFSFPLLSHPNSLDIQFNNSQFKNNINDKKSFFNLNSLNKSCFLFDIKWTNNCPNYSLYRDRIQFIDEIITTTHIEVENIFFRDNYAVLYKNIENYFQENCDNDVLEC